MTTVASSFTQWSNRHAGKSPNSSSLGGYSAGIPQNDQHRRYSNADSRWRGTGWLFQASYYQTRIWTEQNGYYFDFITVPALGAFLDQVDEGDTLIASASLGIAADLSRTDENDTLSSAAALAILAQLSLVDSADSLSAQGALAILAALDRIDEADTIVATAIIEDVLPPVLAVLALTDDADSSLATGALAILALLSRTDENDSLDAQADTGAPRSAVLALTDDVDSLSAQATVPGGAQESPYASALRAAGGFAPRRRSRFTTSTSLSFGPPLPALAPVSAAVNITDDDDEASGAMKVHDSPALLLKKKVRRLVLLED